MKLLINFSFILIFLAIMFGGEFIYADEVSDSYQVRYERWAKSRNAKSSNVTNTRGLAAENQQPKNVPAQKLPTQKLTVQELPKLLPRKSEPRDSSLKENASVNEAKSNEAVPPELNQRKISNAGRGVSVRKMALDAREEFLNNIPEENEQVQALLTMVDHTKVYFSINQNGALKELFKDDRFREIYTEEMKPETRKLTYYFFKGYQDHQRMPNQPVQKSLNRNVTINRERIDSYLETTGIKSKLTRSLQGRYPVIPPKPVREPVATDSGGSNQATDSSN